MRIFMNSFIIVKIFLNIFVNINFLCNFPYYIYNNIFKIMKIKFENFKSEKLNSSDLFPIVGGSAGSTTRSGTSVTRSSGADIDMSGNDSDNG